VSSFHCDKLCSGECCAPLRWALSECDETSVRHCRRHWKPGEYHACLAVVDSAKLAELMAMALLGRGFARDGDRSVSADRRVCVGIHGGLIWVGIGDTEHKPFFMPKKALSFAMPEARAATLAIMTTSASDSSRDACERIVRGGP
jgi:hypothetical protein